MAELQELFREGGWSIHRLAGKASLSKATVQVIVNRETTVISQTGTLKAFVTACGHDPERWAAARGRAVQATKAAERPKPVTC